MENNYFIFYESLFRAGAASLSNSSLGFDSLLREGRISLLLEQFTDEDANNLASALKVQSERTSAVAGALPDSMRETKDLLKRLSGEIDQISNTREIAIMAQKGDTGGIKQKIEQLNSVVLRVGNITSAVVDTMLRASENLKNVVEELTKDQKVMTLLELKTSLGNSKDPDEKKAYAEIAEVLKAVISSFKIPDWHTSAVEKGSEAAKSASGGLWGAIKGFFKGIFGKVAGAIIDEGRSAFTKDMQGMSINDIMNAEDSMKAAKTALIGATESASEQTAVATGEAAAAVNPEAETAAGAESPSAQTPATSQGAQKFSRNAWLNVVDGIKDNPKKQKDFIDQINSMAGREILEHNRASQLDALSEDRWASLAGIKGNKLR